MFNRFFRRRAGTGRSDAPAGASAASMPKKAPLVDRSGDVDLGMLFAILLRQWLLIGVIAALFVGAGVAYLKVTPKVWKATARVLLDPRDKQVAGQGYAQPVQGIDVVWIDTQADLVTSSAILEAVIDRLQLQNAPDFGGSRDVMMRKLVEATNVQRADQTYVLDINVFTHAPDWSARIAQALADAYVANITATKAEAGRQASALIKRQLDELRDAARSAQEKLETYKRDHGLISANGRSVEEDTLRQLNDAYVAAQVRTRDAKAKRDRLATALASANGEDALDGIDSPVLSRLKIDAAQAARNLDDLSHQLGPNHPRMIAARAALDRAREQIAGELKSLAAAGGADYDVARAAEDAAGKAVDRASVAVADSGEAGVLLKELENEASLRADLYRNYLARTAEIGLQANTQLSDASVVVPASPPLYPYAPRSIVVLGIAGIAGLGLGLSLAIYRGRKYLPELLRRKDGEADRAASPAEPEAAPLVAVETLPSVPPPEPEAPEVAVASAAAAALPLVAAAATAARDGVVDPAAPRPGTGAEVLAALSVSTAPTLRNRLGRSIVRGPRDILLSAFETSDGNPLPGARARTEALLRRVEATAGRSRVLMTIGVGDDPAAAAVALAVARIEPDGGRGVLVVDASSDRPPLAAAFTGDDPPGIVDVIVDGVDGGRIAVCPPEIDVTLIAVGSPARLADVDAHTGDIAAFVEELAADYGRLILHFGHRHSLRLMDALMKRADALLIVADRAVEGDAESVAMIGELAAAVPVFSGLVLVDQRLPGAQTAAEVA